MADTIKLITVKEVLKITGYKSRTTLWRRVKAGNFPAPIVLSSHATRWKKNEIDEWIDALPESEYGVGGRLN